MSVSVLRNSREQPPLVAVVECGGANLDGGGGKNSAASASPCAVVPAAASAAVAGHSEEETPLNNNVERKNIEQPLVAVRLDQAAQYQPPPPQPANSIGIPITRNFKTSASTSTDVRAVARRACAPKSAGFGPSLFNRQQLQSGYRPRRRVHSVSEDDGNVATRTDIFSASFPTKRPRFLAKPQSTYQFQPQKVNFTGNSANGGYRRTGEPRFPKRARSGTNPLLNQPPAPNNTTQFLITDHEEREDLPSTSAESGVDDATATQPANSIDAAAADQSINTITGNEEPCSSSGHRRRSSDTVVDTFDEEFIEDPEFAAVCDDYNLERIMSLSRDEVNREMLETQKDNLHLSEKVEILRADNLRLRAMLRDCGYDDVSAPAAALTTAAILPAALRKSASPDTTLIHPDNHGDEKEDEQSTSADATPKREEGPE